MTRIPRCRLSATFSAICRHTLQVRNRLSPSFHSLVLRSMTRGVEATRNEATGWPDEVKRSSGSLTRFPTIVICVSPAAMGVLQSLVGLGGVTGVGLAVLGPQDLGPQHGLVEVELAVQFLDGRGLRGQVDDGVDAL